MAVFWKPIDIIGGFILQMVFMQSLFGYLMIMMEYKWAVGWFEADGLGTLNATLRPASLTR
jgi:V-type H+-transporting ATPase subunit a